MGQVEGSLPKKAHDIEGILEDIVESLKPITGGEKISQPLCECSCTRSHAHEEVGHGWEQLESEILHEGKQPRRDGFLCAIGYPLPRLLKGNEFLDHQSRCWGKLCQGALILG